jgi:NTE family protein
MKSASSGTLLLVLLALRCWAAVAPHETPTGPLDAGQVPVPRWVLVLSGGGARGIAQIGVLRVLERERLYPSAVVGTSIGAVIGGLWCAGIHCCCRGSDGCTQS